MAQNAKMRQNTKMGQNAKLGLVVIIDLTLSGMPHALTYIYSSSHNTMGGKKREQWKQKWPDRHLMLFPPKCVKYKLPVSFLMNDLPL